MTPESSRTEPLEPSSISERAVRHPEERPAGWAPRRRWSVAELIARATTAPPTES